MKSITDIEKNISFYVEDIEKIGNKIIFVNNKPKAVLMDIKIYENLIKKSNLEIEFEPLSGSFEMINTEEHKNLLSLMRKA